MANKIFIAIVALNVRKVCSFSKAFAQAKTPLSSINVVWFLWMPRQFVVDLLSRVHPIPVGFAQFSVVENSHATNVAPTWINVLATCIENVGKPICFLFAFKTCQLHVETAAKALGVDPTCFHVR